VNKIKLLAVLTCVAVLTAPIVEAQAKRLGSGGNVGRVAPSPSAKPQAIPAKPAAPAPQAAPQGQQAAKPAAPAPAAQQPAKNSWLGPIAGIAAGLGLAALASYLGFGEELMSLMLIVLAVVIAFALFRWISLRRRTAQAGSFGEPAMARSGYGASGSDAQGSPGQQGWASQSAGNVSAAQTVAIEAPATPSANISGEEVEQFLKVAREQFTRLQTIWDSGNIHALAEFCTPEMTRELSHQIADRKGAANVTQVVSLQAEWLGMQDSQDDFGKPVDEVQIRFSGLIRESADAAASDFDEVWTLHRVKGGDTGWMLAGIAQLGH
jgi:predicted lipid-binding transport protein (Tim44 family)